MTKNQIMMIDNDDNQTNTSESLVVFETHMRVRGNLGSFALTWEQRKLGDLVVEYSDPVPTPHEGYERLGIRSHGKGTFHNYVKAGHELETAQMHRVAADKLIVNITFAWEHAVAVTDVNDAGKLVSHRFPQFSLSPWIMPSAIPN